MKHAEPSRLQAAFTRYRGTDTHLSVVSPVIVDSAADSDATPAAPILLPLKLKCVKRSRRSRHFRLGTGREQASKSPDTYFNVARPVINDSDPDNDVAPSAPISLSLILHVHIDARIVT